MIPLPPPTGYWRKLDSLLKNCDCNGKCPALNGQALQSKDLMGDGHIQISNFTTGHFLLRTLVYWLDDDKRSSWKNIEQDLILPLKLKDFLFIQLSTKKCDLYYGHILTYMLVVFRAGEKHLGCKSVWYKLSPLWDNTHLLSRGRPFYNKNWDSTLKSSWYPITPLEHCAP